MKGPYKHSKTNSVWVCVYRTEGWGGPRTGVTKYKITDKDSTVFSSKTHQSLSV